MILPDFVVNAGGVICATTEYHGGNETMALAAIEEKIRRNTALVIERSRRAGVSMREAATGLATSADLERGASSEVEIEILASRVRDSFDAYDRLKSRYFPRETGVVGGINYGAHVLVGARRLLGNASQKWASNDDPCRRS